MLGILYYLIYVIAGLYIGAILFNQYKPFIRLSISLAAGTILSVWLPAVLSLMLGKFNILANTLALFLLTLIIGIVFIYNRKYKKISLKDSFLKIDKKETILISLSILPLIIIIFILFYGHVLLESEGALYGGQSTFGDLSMHMGMITSIANQGMFPPDYSILPGTRLCYPFLVNLQSASMYLMGTSLRWSILFPSMILSFSCFLGLYALARDFLKKHNAAVLAMYLFFITGGLGFIFYLSKDGMMYSLFNDYYMAPTNYPPLNLRWVNVICDMMVPQRTFLIGLSTVLPILLLIKKSIEEDRNINMLYSGIMASSLPMIHTHSFLALGIICAGLLFGGAYFYEKSMKDWIKKWIIFLIPVIVFAAPQLFFWIFTQSQNFLRINIDWVNNGDSWIWFWTKNVGLPFLLIVPAFLYADNKKRLWYASATIIYIIAEVIAFQPNEYDNNKLMLIWYVFTAIITADYMIMLYNKLNNIKGRIYLTIVTCIVLFSSGILTIGREINSNKQYMQYSLQQVETAQTVSDFTDTDILFVTGRQHLNEIAALAGRNIYAGSTLYVHFHGLDYTGRYTQIEDIYTDSHKAVEILKEINADYLYISSYERSYYSLDENLYEIFPVVYSNSDIEILAVSDEAIQNGIMIIEK